MRTGYWHRLCLPDAGTVMDQSALIMDAFRIIKDTYDTAMSEKIKHG